METKCDLCEDLFTRGEQEEQYEEKLKQLNVKVDDSNVCWKCQSVAVKYYSDLRAKQKEVKNMAVRTNN